jgi:hypothetical protein
MINDHKQRSILCKSKRKRNSDRDRQRRSDSDAQVACECIAVDDELVDDVLEQVKEKE